MPYRFATEDQVFSDYSGGRVLYSQPGFAAFPVRFASEIFQRAWEALAPAGPITLYDPMCGGAYHLSALGFLHGEKIGKILASDADEAALDLARRNLGLLEPDGLRQRAAALQSMLEKYGKESHREALRSVEVLRQRLETVRASHEIHTCIFQANALETQSLQSKLAGQSIDLLFSDIPYGHLSLWKIPDGLPGAAQNPLWQALEAFRPILSTHTVVAIAADKSQKAAHPAYRRIGKVQVGKRQAVLLRLV